MGFLDQNTTYLGTNISFPVVEGYCGSIGAAMANIEAQQNDFALFEAALRCDFNEAIALKEGAEEIVPLQEASLKGIGDAIVKFLTKLGEKIKSIFTSFMAKFDSYLKKDTKAFAQKYAQVVGAKTSFKHMKAKWSEPKTNSYVYENDYTFLLSLDTTDAKAEFVKEEYIEERLGKVLDGSSVTTKDFQKELHSKMYKDEEVKEDWTKDDMKTIYNRLVSGDKPISELKRKNEVLQTAIKKAIASIDKDVTNLSRKTAFDSKNDRVRVDYHGSFGSDDPKNNRSTTAELNDDKLSNLQKRMGILQQMAVAEQTAITTYCSATFNEAKWGLAQDRRLYAQAAAFNPNRYHEDASLIEAIGETAEYECLSDFDAMEILA